VALPESRFAAAVATWKEDAPMSTVERRVARRAVVAAAIAAATLAAACSSSRDSAAPSAATQTDAQQPTNQSNGSGATSEPGEPGGAELAKLHGLAILPVCADGVPIRVVDAKSGKAVGDALVVRVVEAQFAACFSSEYYRELDSYRLLQCIGKSRLTASDGTTRVEPPSGWEVAVFAFRGRDFGRATIELHDSSEHVVAIAPRQLDVEVVDATGRPQKEIPLALATCSFAAFDPGAWRGVTGVDGRVSIPALDLERHVHRTCGRRATVVFDLPARGNAPRSLDTPQLEPVRLVLPECGELVVDLLDASGEPYPIERLRAHSASLVVRPEGLGGFGVDRARPLRFEDASIVKVPCRSSRIHLPLVEVGMPLTVWVDVDEWSVENGNATCSTSSLEWCNSPDSCRVAVAALTSRGEVRHVVLREKPDSAVDEAPAQGVASEAATVVRPEVPPPSSMDEEDTERAVQSSIAVRVLCDVPIRPLELRARLRSESAADPQKLEAEVDPDVSSEAWIDPKGLTTIRRVPEGDWTVALLLCHGYSTAVAPVELARFEHVHVAPISYVRDPRLLAIDLRGMLRRRHVDAVDSDGRPLSGVVHLRDPKSGKFDSDRDLDGGVCDFLTTKDDARRLVVAVDRFRPVDLAATDTVSHVVLRRGLPVRLTLDPNATRPTGSPKKLFVGVCERPRCGQPADVEAEDATVRTVPLEPGGTASFDVPESGDWRVILLATKDEPVDAAPSYERLDAQPPTIHVDERDGEQLFTVAPVTPSAPTMLGPCLRHDSTVPPSSSSTSTAR
jgi:hypothetical protein